MDFTKQVCIFKTNKMNSRGQTKQRPPNAYKRIWCDRVQAAAFNEWHKNAIVEFIGESLSILKLTLLAIILALMRQTLAKPVKMFAHTIDNYLFSNCQHHGMRYLTTCKRLVKTLYGSFLCLKDDLPQRNLLIVMCCSGVSFFGLF